MTGEDLELSSVLLIRWNGIAGARLPGASLRHLPLVAKFCLQYVAEIASLGFISTYPRGEEQSEKTVDNGVCPRPDSLA